MPQNISMIDTPSLQCRGYGERRGTFADFTCFCFATKAHKGSEAYESVMKQCFEV